MKDKKYIISIDTGTYESAYCVYNKETKQLADKNYLPNIKCFEIFEKYFSEGEVDLFIIELSQGTGAAAGMEMFMNCHFQGFYACLAKKYNVPVKLLLRKTVKYIICGAFRGVNDASINLMLREEYGEDYTKKGKKYNFYYNEEVISHGGREYMQNDLWQALGLIHAYLLEPDYKQKELSKIDIEYLNYIENLN